MDKGASRRCKLALPRRLFAMGLAVVSLAVAAEGTRGADYPSKPVRLFVPYGAGGVGDLTMRLLANKLGEQTKQPFVIENRPGAGGILAMTEALRAPADGYALAEVGNGQAVTAALFNKLPFDTLKDFSPVSIAARFEILLAVPGSSPYRSLKDIVEAARKSPGKLNIAAINPGSTQNLSAHLFRQLTGADFALVTYRTTPDLVTALLRGEVDLAFDYYAGLAPELGDGKVRIIATSGEARNPLLKDVPTAKEAGFPQYVVVGWNGIAVRAGVPADIVQALNTQINRALAAPEVQEQGRTLGIDARGSTPQEMRERLTAEIARWRDVIEKAGIPKL
jgi:tripartite-type tricarboxylate transporter receptor subunit TctC